MRVLEELDEPVTGVLVHEVDAREPLDGDREAAGDDVGAGGAEDGGASTGDILPDEAGAEAARGADDEDRGCRHWWAMRDVGADADGYVR